MKMNETGKLRKISRELFKAMDQSAAAESRKISLRLALIAELKKSGLDAFTVDGVTVGMSSRVRNKIEVDERLHNAFVESGVYPLVATVSAALVAAQMDGFSRSLRALISKRMIVAKETFITIRGK